MNMKKKVFNLLLVVIAVIVIAFCIKGTAYSMEKNDGSTDMERYYISLEKEYVSEVKAILDSEGYTNAGVMMTKMVSVDGNRDYTLTIHHKKTVEKEVLNSIANLELPIGKSSISVMTTN